ncbi:MAG TPA: right-handed parallel beta-helix repeat-containing protein [Arenicellales bacterium]|nr:right-handed parallel beta-helix repeat-containing protein [Arenicellales bacterium]
MFRLSAASATSVLAFVLPLLAQAQSHMAGGLPALEERVSRIEDVIGGPPRTEFNVDCGAGETIGDALQDATPLAPITITVQGVCQEHVTIERDDVTVQGADSVPSHGVEGSITVTGATRINLNDLIVRGVAGDGSIGVWALKHSSVMMTNLSVSGHDSTGILVSQNSVAVITTTDVTNPSGGFNALAVNDGGHARVSDSSFFSNNGEVNNGAAVGLFRSAHVRFEGDNDISNAVDSNDVNRALAIQAIGNSSVRIQNGNNVIDGNLLASGITNIDLRGATVTGRADIGANSRLRLFETNVTGDVFLATDSLLDTVAAPGVAPAASMITGDLNCVDSQSQVEDVNLLVTGTTSAACTVE